jgi:catechol 2,3-dioxygenase-like lactoylglutathione lyase family enzyme
MSFHHVAIATRDTRATHAFYAQATGFPLVKVEVVRVGEEGWGKHLFYDTGGDGLLAFWELHDESIPADFSPAIASGLGLPRWTNHIAFAASDRSDLEARKKRWLEHGIDVVEIDHGWCRSIYANDPNDIMVEFCVTTAAFGAAERERAARLLADPAPDVPEPPPVRVHRASEYRGD